VDEERITSQGEANSLRLASNSAVPQRPVAPRRLLNTVIAAVLSAFVVAIFISARQWWTVHDKEPAKG